ncbi:MAG: PAS domain S-box protein [Methylobacter sp.]|nr:PAS domain S-box protein [Methylobacter sp.]MDP3054859.1 PAS domain S-box protein [Methylobacter sp.]MDP3363815.1 PAS domain S-box protein [Methylobacter sp.]
MDQSADLLSSVLDAATEVSIVATDAQGVITVFNRGAELFLGYRADEVVGKQSPALFHLASEVAARSAKLSQEYGVAIEGFRVFVHNPELYGREHRQWTYVCKDGHHIQVSLIVTAMRSADGTITGYLGIGHDITKEIRVHKAVKEFKNMLNQAYDCIFMFRADTLGFTYVNRGATLQLGYSCDELLQMSPLDIKPEFNEADFRQRLQPLLEGTKTSVVFETVHRHKQGHTIPVEVSIQLVSEPEHEPLFVNVVRDITERKAVEQALQENLQHTQAILNNVIDGIITIDNRGIVQSFNRAGEAIFGYTADEVIGKNVNILMPEPYHSEHDGYLQNYHTTGIQRIIGSGREVEGLRKDGTVFPMDLAVSRSIHNGQPLFIGLVRDITERKAVEQALQENLQHTQAILNNVIDGIITIDNRGIVQSFNRAGEAIFGYTADEVIGKNVNILMPEPYHSEHDGYLQNYHATGIQRIIGSGREVEGLRKDGTVFPMDLAVSRSIHNGQPLFIGLVRDITERKRVDQMKVEFVSTVSHELRTPLTSISGALGLVIGGALGELPASVKQMLDIAYKNSKRLALLINDLLDMEKLLAGKMHLDLQTQALMPLVEETLESVQAYGEQYQVVFNLVERADDVQVRVDAGRLQQVLTNFLSNAAKFSPAGAEVKIAVRRHKNVLHLEVIDQGPGIPAEFHGRIFQKFSQADASDTRQKGGTGLGLAISKELIERMNGLIGFDSEEGQGARFYLQLPVVQAQDIVPTSVDPLILGAERLLVVEDDPDIATLLSMMLRRAGYQVDVADTGELALNYLARNEYAAMTLDLMLPDQSGIALMRQIRSQAETEGLPIIVVSAFTEGGKLAINGDFSVVDWIDKPFDEERLTAAVLRALPVLPTLKPRVLHVEDDVDLHYILATLGRDLADFEVAHNLTEARAKLAFERYNLVVLDIGLPDGSGWELMMDLKQLDPEPPVIVLSGSELTATQKNSVQAALVKTRIPNQDLLDTLKKHLNIRKT